MERIELNGQPNGRCSRWSRLKSRGELERIMDRAKELQFEFTGMGVVEIKDIGHSPNIYESPVIYLEHKYSWTKAVISQSRSDSGVVFSIHYYKKGE